MTWINFIMILMIVYLAYYGLNVVFDLFMIRNQPSNSSDHELLFFHEDTIPELISYDEEPESISAPPMVESREPSGSSVYGFAAGVFQSTGAVSIKELLLLAKDEAIEFTREIPY